jgi:hypothetical protein
MDDENVVNMGSVTMTVSTVTINIRSAFCIYVFRVILSVSSSYFLKQR